MMKRATASLWRKMMSVLLCIVLITGMITSGGSLEVKADVLTVTAKLQITVKGFSGTNADVLGKVTLQDVNNPSAIYECTNVSVNQDIITYEAADISLSEGFQEGETKHIAYHWLLDGEILVDAQKESNENQEYVDEVTFCSVWFKDGDQILDTQYVRQNSTASFPELNSNVLEKEGYSFEGWVKQEGGSERFDFEQEITEETSIYALWKAQEIEMPKTSLEEGVYQVELEVELLCHEPDVDIYYTLDGSEPTQDSEKYTEPIELKGKAGKSVETIIKAISVKYGLSSEIAEFVYTIELPRVSMEEDGNVTFVYENDIAESVYVAGSFNDFAVEEQWQLHKNKDGIWELTKELESGVYSYVFIVDGEEQIDPNNNSYYLGTDKTKSKLVVSGDVKSPVVSGDGVTFYYPVSQLPEDVTKVSVLIYGYHGGEAGEMSLSADGTHYMYSASHLDKGKYEYEIVVDRESNPLFSEYYQDFYNMEANPVSGYSTFVIDQEHSHYFEEKWTSDETEHWHMCRCGERAEIAAHKKDEGAVTTEPTEDSAGVKTYCCEVCGYEMETELLPKLPHIHDYNQNMWKIDADNHWHECRCKDKIDIAPHVSDEGTVTIKPTQTKTGVMTYSCIVCKAVLQTKTIAATGTTNDNGANDNENVSNGENDNNQLDSNEEKEDKDKEKDKDNNKESDDKKDNDGKKDNDKTNSEADGKYPVKNSSANGGGRDNEPNTGADFHIEIYASLAMIAGLSYIRLYFENGKKGMTEKEKEEIIARLVGWAKKGNQIRKYVAIAAVFCILAYYHSIGKSVAVEWKEIYGK